MPPRPSHPCTGACPALPFQPQPPCHASIHSEGCPPSPSPSRPSTRLDGQPVRGQASPLLPPTGACSPSLIHCARSHLDGLSLEFQASDLDEISEQVGAGARRAWPCLAWPRLAWRPLGNRRAGGCCHLPTGGMRAQGCWRQLRPRPAAAWGKPARGRGAGRAQRAASPVHLCPRAAATCAQTSAPHRPPPALHTTMPAAGGGRCSAGAEARLSSPSGSAAWWRRREAAARQGCAAPVVPLGDTLPPQHPRKPKCILRRPWAANVAYSAWCAPGITGDGTLPPAASAAGCRGMTPTP